jgi:hypothetical protein
VSNVREEPWGRSAAAGSTTKLAANVLAPRPFPAACGAAGLDAGTTGRSRPTSSSPPSAPNPTSRPGPASSSGKVVLNQPIADVPLLTARSRRRFTDQELIDMQTQPVNPGRGRGARGGGAPANADFRDRLNEFFAQRGVVATLEPGPGRNDRGTILVHNAPATYYSEKPPAITPQLIVASEQYNRIFRLVDGKVPVQLELNVQNGFTDGLDSVNVVAELPGTDKAAEVVMLGAHFDSWHAGTGATDNAVGSAVMMEAMRILKTTRLPLRRTVRLALWTGEEQGLLGSRAYAKQHFGDRESMVLNQEHARLSGYFNMDNGGGAIRGVYPRRATRRCARVRAWMEPFRSLGMTTLAMRNTGSTDHVAFDESGMPGFQFIQDPLEYGTDSHHSNNDVYDRVPAGRPDEERVIIASFVYHTANRDELLPRKPLPRPRPRPAATQ